MPCLARRRTETQRDSPVAVGERAVTERQPQSTPTVGRGGVVPAAFWLELAHPRRLSERTHRIAGTNFWALYVCMYQFRSWNHLKREREGGR